MISVLFTFAGSNIFFMTSGEERILYESISVIILALAIGIYIGFILPAQFFTPKSLEKNESYFQTKSAELYSDAMDYLETKNNQRKQEKLEILIKKVNAYNQDSEETEITEKDWKFHCPYKFSVDYLINKIEIGK